MYYLNHRFTDYHHFADTVRGWDLDFRQLDRGPFRSDLRQLVTDDVHLAHARFNRALEQRGGIPPGRWTVALLEPSSPGIVWRGRRVSSRNVMIYPPGSEIDAASPPGFHVWTVSIPTEVVERWHEWHRPGGAHRKERLAGGVVRMEAARLAAIRDAARRLMASANVADARRDALSREVVGAVLKALTLPMPSRPKAAEEKRSRVLARLTDYIEAKLDDPITLMDLCSAAGASPRTIQRAFRHRFGTTPKRYILARRLNRVRQDLATGRNPEKRVADIANRWGFWHMGQFAADYRRFFGELPSETLARSRR